MPLCGFVDTVVDAVDTVVDAVDIAPESAIAAPAFTAAAVCEVMANCRRGVLLEEEKEEEEEEKEREKEREEDEEVWEETDEMGMKASMGGCDSKEACRDVGKGGRLADDAVEADEGDRAAGALCRADEDHSPRLVDCAIEYFGNRIAVMEWRAEHIIAKRIAATEPLIL